MPHGLDDFQRQMGSSQTMEPVEELVPEDAGALLVEMFENPMMTHGEHPLPPEKQWAQSSPPMHMTGHEEEGGGMDYSGEDAEAMRDMMYEKLGEHSDMSEQYQEDQEDKDYVARQR